MKYYKTMNNNELKENYPMLSGLSAGFTAIGTLLIIGSIILLYLGFTELGSYDKSPAYYYFGSMVGGLILSLFFFAIPEIIKVLVKIEINTRMVENRPVSSSSHKGGIKLEESSQYEEWKKANPEKSINDYYSTR